MQYLKPKHNEFTHLNEKNNFKEFFIAVAKAKGYINSFNQICYHDFEDYVLKLLKEKNLPLGIKPSFKQFKKLFSNKIGKIPVFTFDVGLIILDVATQIKDFKFNPTTDGKLCVTSYLFGKFKPIVEELNRTVKIKIANKEDVSGYSVEEIFHLKNSMDEINSKYGKSIEECFS